MNFNLGYTPPVSPVPIGHKHKILLIGSCFAESIGEQLTEHRFSTLTNPSGILFNPLSICQRLRAALNNETMSDSHILERDGRYVSYFHHSAVSAASPEELKELIKRINLHTREFLTTCDFIFLTLGSAYVYKIKQSGDIAANCHKMDATAFRKELVSPEVIADELRRTLTEIRTLNPKAEMVVTISPVKYLRDGIVGNNLSKASLLLAAHGLAETMPRVQYFPAYELVNDDLRDYRFYKEDMAHPNQQAVNYIWEKFGLTFFSENTRAIVEEIRKLNQSAAHRPGHPGGPAEKGHRDYILRQKERIKALDPDITL